MLRSSLTESPLLFRLLLLEPRFCIFSSLLIMSVRTLILLMVFSVSEAMKVSFKVPFLACWDAKDTSFWWLVSYYSYRDLTFISNFCVLDGSFVMAALL